MTAEKQGALVAELLVVMAIVAELILSPIAADQVHKPAVAAVLQLARALQEPLALVVTVTQVSGAVAAAAAIMAPVALMAAAHAVVHLIRLQALHAVQGLEQV